MPIVSMAVLISYRRYIMTQFVTILSVYESVEVLEVTFPFQTI